MMKLRGFVAMYAILVSAAVLLSPASYARAQTNADKLIEDFYAWYPCSAPTTAFNVARTNPWLPRAILASSRPERDRYAAYQLMVGAQARGFKETIKLALTDRSDRIRSTAIHHLPLVFSDEELVQQYVRLLDDPYSGVRYNCAEALAKYPSQQAREPLLKLLDDKSIEARFCALGTLLSWNDDQVKVRLRELARSENVTVAGTAVTGLARDADEPIDLAVLHSYVQQELERLTGPPFAGTGAVVYLIGLITEKGDESSAIVLEAAAAHKHSSVRQAALKAAAEIKARKDE
jgi:HEAT repeat protein